MKNTKKTKTALVFGAHPDDLEIGMGGTVAKLGKLGYDVKLVIASTPDHPKGMREVRKAEQNRAAKIMRCDPPEFLDLKSSEYMFNRALVGRLDKIIQKHNPEAVFTQWIGDSHQDHQILTRCVLAASRRVDTVLMYETTIPSLVAEVPFAPKLYVDISDTINTKTKALEAHKTQAKIYGPHWIKSITGRSAYRGFQIRKPYAEAFDVTKIVKW